MNLEWQERTANILNYERINALNNSNLLIVGLGGVGGYTAEFLCRSGVGNFTLVDGDYYELTNLNRQNCALNSTLNKKKTDIVTQRLKDINPEVKITPLFEYMRDNRTEEILDSANFDYVIDTIDSLTPKMFLIKKAKEKNHNVISSMGTGRKIDPSKVQICDIADTFNCKLARALRKRLNRFGIKEGIKTVFSPESPYNNISSPVGTISFMPATFACFCASEVITDIITNS